MIDIDKLTEKDIGKLVLYNPGYKKEKGIIKSWNDKYIFVVYNCGKNYGNFKNYTAAATEPKDLTFEIF